MSKNIKTLVLNVDVKRKHIDEGMEGDGSMCAIALATQDALKAMGCAGDVEVGADSDTLDIGNNLSLAMPKKGADFIAKFDKTTEGDEKRAKLKPFKLQFKISLCDLLVGQ